MRLPNFKKIAVKPYVPGKSKLLKTRNIIKLSANESALGISPKVKKVINSSRRSLSKYPDSRSKELRLEISKNYKCNFDNIICGSGSDEIIQLLCQLFLKPKDEVIVPQYSFLMYRIYAKIAGAKIIYSKEKNFKISINEILKNVSKKTKIIFLANPNNPTGTYINKKEIIKLRKSLRSNILLVIDDAYFEYMQQKDYVSGLNIFRNKKNVFILRTFSKIYGLASLRVGWGYGSKEIINALHKIKPPFNVNKIAQVGAVAALKDKFFLKKSIKHNLVWAKKIRLVLNKFDIKTNEIGPNFFLLDFKDCKYSAKFFLKKMEDNGIILRSMISYNIRNALRLSIGSKEDNTKFIKVLNKIFKND